MAKARLVIDLSMTKSYYLWGRIHVTLVFQDM